MVKDNQMVDSCNALRLGCLALASAVFCLEVTFERISPTEKKTKEFVRPPCFEVLKGGNFSRECIHLPTMDFQGICELSGECTMEFVVDIARFLLFLEGLVSIVLVWVGLVGCLFVCLLLGLLLHL